MIKEYLRERYKEYIMQQMKDGNVSPSQSEFVQTISEIASRKLEKPVSISVASFNQWINGVRLPVGDNIEYLAAAFGPQVYDVMGKPRVMPNDPILKLIVDDFELLDEEERDQLLQFINTILEDKKTKLEAG